MATTATIDMKASIISRLFIAGIEVYVFDGGHVSASPVRTQVHRAARPRSQLLAQLVHRVDRLRVAHPQHLGPRLLSGERLCTRCSSSDSWVGLTMTLKVPLPYSAVFCLIIAKSPEMPGHCVNPIEQNYPTSWLTH